MIAEQFFPEEGRVPRVVLESTKRLVKRGHRVCVLRRRCSPESANKEILEEIHILRYNIDSKDEISYYVSSIINAKNL